MPEHRIFGTPFAKVYPMYVQKAARKNRSREEVDQLVCWLTGYDEAGLQRQIEAQKSVAEFFAEAPGFNPNSALITGTGVRRARRSGRGSPDAEDPLSGQAGGRAGERKANEEDPAPSALLSLAIGLVTSDNTVVAEHLPGSSSMDTYR